MTSRGYDGDRSRDTKAGLRLTLLGSFRLQVGGEETDLESRTVEALLAYLVLHRNRPHAREVLCGLFWPDKSEPNARMNLRHALYALRRALGSEILVADRRTVRLHPELSLELDVEAFERLLARSRHASTPRRQIRLLRRALALYRGPLLEGFYYDWVIEAQQRLREEYLTALQRLAERLASQGEVEEALRCVERLLGEAPYREEGYRLGMGLLAQKGQAAEALRLYERCRQALKELRLEPSPATRRLAEWIAQGKVPTALPPEPVLPSGSVPLRETVRDLDPEERIWRLNALGRLARERGHLARAEGLHKEALALALRRRHPEGVLEARRGIGLVLWARGDLRRAREELERALRTARHLERERERAAEGEPERAQDPGPFRHVADVLMDLGIVAMQRGRYPEAQRHYVEALGRYRRLRDSRRIAQAFNNLAILAYHQGEPAQAARLFERTLTLARRQNDLPLAARCLNNLGNLARRLGQHDEAEARLRAALELFEELQDPREAANTLANLGAVALERGDLGEARRRLQQALRLALEIEAQGIALYALVRFAQLRRAEGRPDRAAEVAALVRETAEEGSWAHRRAGRLLRELKLKGVAVQARRQAPHRSFRSQVETLLT